MKSELQVVIAKFTDIVLCRYSLQAVSRTLPTPCTTVHYKDMCIRRYRSDFKEWYLGLLAKVATGTTRTRSFESGFYLTSTHSIFVIG